MPENPDVIYLSGEKIPISGTYVVVGVGGSQADQEHEHAIAELKAGESFPNYKGIAVSWHFTGEQRVPEKEEVPAKS